ncbi:MAG: ferrous iron transport protein A [Synergistaceae bacterium]|nr:ferrous iron transport protein A [Synergistaceae bacterium]
MISAMTCGGSPQMPLSFLNGEEACAICKIGGGEKTRKFLESLGLVAGGEVMMVSKNEGGVILNVRESRLAISREMADKIMVEPKSAARV